MMHDRCSTELLIKLVKLWNFHIYIERDTNVSRKSIERFEEVVAEIQVFRKSLDEKKN